MRGKGNHLLLGVTGGIATGKTLVARMLEQLGAFLIDLDLLAREVVEPGKPAFKQILDYFGRGVLGKDGALDRKKLSRIVFQDAHKREKLESFTHPPIHEAFVTRVNEIAEGHPEAIVQAVVPLLIEKGLQHMFDKILVVYTPRALQIKRLTARDGISEEEASMMLQAQLPIDEKLGYADFVVRNEGAIEGTRKQVEDIWRTLKKLQEEKASE